ncbi:MAG: AzlD domain-containing protein [Firmicutes bacterium]|nr:AzlD domain-containing protein [Bacillota bacterium]
MRTEVLTAIIGMMLVTYIPRALPLIALKDKELPKFIVSWLQFIPVAILASLLVPSLFQIDGQWVFSWHNPFFLAALPTLLVAIKTRSLMLTTFSGMAAAALLNNLT